MQKDKKDLLDPINKYKAYLGSQGTDFETINAKNKPKKKTKGSSIVGVTVLVGMICGIVGFGGLSGAKEQAKTSMISNNVIATQEQVEEKTSNFQNQEYEAEEKLSHVEIDTQEQNPQIVIQPKASAVINETPSVTTQSKMVWLSATGSKYHSKPNCGTMNPDKARQVTEEDAKSCGYEPCSKCWK